MNTLLYALTPILVTGITSLFKRLPGMNTIPEGVYLWTIRFVCAVLSFLGVVATSYATGDPIDPSSVEAFSLTAMTFLGSVGAHYLGKKK